MKKIIVKRIDVMSLAKPLLFFAGVGGLIVGIGFSLFSIPTSMTTTSTTDGKLISSVTTPIAGAFGGIMSAVFGSMLYCIMLALVILVGILLFNLFLRITGGIKILIEEEEQ